MNTAERPCVYSKAMFASDGVGNHNTSAQSLYGLKRVPIFELTDCPSTPSQQPESELTIVALEQDCIYGRGPSSTKRHPFRSLGNDVICEGISRQQFGISKVYDDKSGIDFTCCADTNNKIGIIPYRLNTDSPSGQKRQIQLHASNKQNGVFYVSPGNSAQLQVNDWIIFDLYRKIPKHVFRLIWLRDEVAEASFHEGQDNDITHVSSFFGAEQEIDLEATRCIDLTNAESDSSSLHKRKKETPHDTCGMDIQNNNGKIAHSSLCEFGHE